MIILSKQNGSKIAINHNKIAIVEPVDNTSESKIWFSGNQKTFDFIIVKEDFSTVLDIIKKAQKTK